MLFSITFLSKGQVRHEWKPLPHVEGIPAYIMKKPAEVVRRIPKNDPVVITETYTGENVQFISRVVPEKLEKLEFHEFDLSWIKRTDVPGGFVFKDLSQGNIRYLDKAHGLISNSITSITEDINGLIYLGTDIGLIMYNDDEMHQYLDHPEFSFKNISGLYFDSNERLWVGTNQGICYIYKDKIFLPKRQIFGAIHLKGFRENVSGELFISTIFNGLFILDKNGIIQYKDNLITAHISDALKARDGKLWLAFGQIGIGYIERDSLFVYKRGDGVLKTARSFIENEGEIWIGLFRGELLKLRNDSLFSVNLNAVNQNIYSLAKNGKGVWMTDYGKGVYLIKNNKEVEFYGALEGLTSSGAYTLHIDKFDNVWVGDLSKGISRIDENIFSISSKPINHRRVLDIEVDVDRNTWYFSEGANLTKENEHDYIEYGGIVKYNAEGFVINDTVWATNLDYGLFSLVNNEFTIYTFNKEPRLDTALISLQVDQIGRIWGVAFATKLYYFFDDEYYNFSASVWPDYKFQRVVKTKSDIIFAITKENGVLAIKGKKYLHFTKENFLESASINHVFEDSKGLFWFCMDGKIQIIDSHGESILIQIPSIENNPVSDILEYEKNSFLAVTSQGILSIKREKNQYDFKLYGKEYGLNLTGNSIIRKDANGTILIGGGDYLIEFDPYFLNKNRPPPSLTLNSIMIGDSLMHSFAFPLKLEQELQFKFSFNKIYWGRGAQLFFSLNKASKGGIWSQTSSNEISFDKLTHGNYQLSVYAEGDQLKSEELNFNFEILPYWYQTQWFKILFAFLVISIVIGYIIYRERNARIVRRKLEEMVNEKTILLQAEKQEVSRQLDQKEILMQEVHHRVKNNLTFLKSLLYLRASASEDKDVKLILDECQARIHSMALVHQNLYDVEDASEVDFHVFLKELFFELESMFDQDRTNIKINLTVSDFKIDMKLSVFLGLILNEMITNSFKYAFANGQEGQISVRLRQVSEKFELSYSDSGQGFPNGFDFKASTGFGFKLINILLSQINAKMHYANNDMSTFTLVIPK